MASLHLVVVLAALEAAVATDDISAMIQRPEAEKPLPVKIFSEVQRTAKRGMQKDSVPPADLATTNNKYFISWDIAMAVGARLNYSVDGCDWWQTSSCSGELLGQHNIEAAYYPLGPITPDDDSLVKIRADTLTGNNTWSRMPGAGMNMRIPLCGGNRRVQSLSTSHALGNFSVQLPECPTERAWMPIYNGTFDLPDALPNVPTRVLIRTQLFSGGRRFGDVHATLYFNYVGESEIPTDEQEKLLEEESDESGAAQRGLAWLAAMLVLAATRMQ